MGFFYKHIFHPIMSGMLGKKSFSNNPYIGMIIDADESDVIADELFRVSLAYHEGQFMLPQSNKKAMEYCLKAAERGHAVAQLFAAQWLMRFSDDHSDEVLQWLTKAAEQGERQSMYNLGISYHRGDIDGTTNVEKSNKLFRDSAERGYVAAFPRMAMIYNNGEGVEKNLNIAKYWAFLEFANMDAANRSQSILNHLIEESDVIDGNKLNHRQIIESAAAAGERDAINNLAENLFESGNKEEAISKLREAANLGHPIAQCNLARHLLQDDSKDYTKAFDLFQQAANQNYEDGSFGLALMYYQGLGRSKDVAKAWEFLEPCINLGDDKARYLFATMCMNNELQEVLPDKVMRGPHYLELASTNGSQPVCNAEESE